MKRFDTVPWWLWLLLFIDLTVYAPMELTRIIINDEVILRFHPIIPIGQFYFEIVFIWVTYLLAVALVTYLAKVRILRR